MNNAKIETLYNWAIYPRLNTLNHAYWFRYIIEDQKSVTEVRYKILVRHLRQETEETSLILINRISDVYINDELPNLCMDELAYETGKVFYPMVIEIDKKAQWVALRNYGQIKEKWFETVRPYVALRYAGKIGEQYLAKMDKVINNKNEIEDIFKNDTFFRLYFEAFYHSYTSEFNINKVLRFPVGDIRLSMFKTECTLNKYTTEKGYKEITQSGVHMYRTSMTDENEIAENDDITYSANILLHAQTNSLREATARWDFKQENKILRLILYPTREQCLVNFEIKLDKRR